MLPRPRLAIVQKWYYERQGEWIFENTKACGTLESVQAYKNEETQCEADLMAAPTCRDEACLRWP